METKITPRPDFPIRLVENVFLRPNGELIIKGYGVHVLTPSNHADVAQRGC